MQLLQKFKFIDINQEKLGWHMRRGWSGGATAWRSAWQRVFRRRTGTPDRNRTIKLISNPKYK